MSHSSNLQLNIWCSDECTFQLLWGERQQMSAKLPYPIELMQQYQAWRKIYLHVYPLCHRGRVETEGSFSSSEDWVYRLQEAEKKLLQKMHQWLGREELLAIRETIISIARSSQSHTSNSFGISLLVACDHSEMIRLPWEAWNVSSQKLETPIHICRTPSFINEQKPLQLAKSRSGKTRILVVLGDAPDLDISGDRAAIYSLEKYADLEFLTLGLDEARNSYIARLKQQLIDDRGWDMLIFSGHSDESALTGGRIKVSQKIAISISEIQSELIEAQKRGLKVALFNSCSGLSLAHSLINLGLQQVMVMREPIHDRVAKVFLAQVCQHLGAHNTLHQAMFDACQYLRAENIAYPSSSLIPSLFCCLQAEPFKLNQSSTWMSIWKKWQPTKSESITLIAVIVISLIFPVHSLLLELRTFMQAVYRDTTHQLPQDKVLPVELISIDQTSINEARNTLDFFQDNPIDRRYLAQIINHLVKLKSKVIGIDYELDIEKEHNEILRRAITNGVNHHSNWFVFASNLENNQRILPKIANTNWSLEGNSLFVRWFIEKPDDFFCKQSCPFAYLLSLVRLINQDSVTHITQQPSLESNNNFQDQLSQSLQQEHHSPTVKRLKKSFSPIPGTSNLIDLSIPPNYIYHKISSKDFLRSSPLDPGLQKRVSSSVVLIAAGNYENAEDKFSVPLAINYWCKSGLKIPISKECPTVFSGGEAHAYMIQHIMKGKNVILIPDIWMVALTFFLSKWVTLQLRQEVFEKRKKNLFRLSFIPLIYGVIGLQLYITMSIALPWFWCSFIFWKSIIPFRRYQNV